MEKSGSQTVTGAKPPQTTFVQTDSTCFRDIVQRLTGSQPEEKEKEKLKETTTTNSKNIVGSSGSKGQAKLKLHERRQYAKPILQIPKPAPMTSNQIQQSIISTDLTLHSPSSTLYNSSTPKQNSPSWNSSCLLRSPLSSTAAAAVSASSPSKRGFVSSPSTNHTMDKDANNVVKAMKERRRLYLQSSPRSKETHDEPELLTLFPLTSPRTM